MLEMDPQAIMAVKRPADASNSMHVFAMLLHRKAMQATRKKLFKHPV